LTLFLSNVTKKWADQAAYSLAGVLCLLKMMIMTNSQSAGNCIVDGSEFCQLQPNMQVFNLKSQA
jgi:hypothetical protein